MIPREMMSLIARKKLVAEVRVDTATQALSVVDALAAGGIGAFEISLTIPGASEILTHYATRGDIIVGAGATLEAQQALDAMSSGARFIASPICEPEIAKVCAEKGIACILGALTPTEIIVAQRAGAEMVKLFPVEAIGGPAYVRSLFRQLTHISVQISGGFSLEHLIEYAGLPVRSIALGALLAPPALVERHAWQAITNRARAFSQFASSPHVFAAQFLAMLSPAPVAPPQPPQPTPAQRAAAAAAKTMPVAPGFIRPPTQHDGTGSGDGSGGLAGRPAPAPAASAAEVAHGPTPSSGPALSRSHSNPDAFRPWDSTPINSGDDEDWLR